LTTPDPAGKPFRYGPEAGKNARRKDAAEGSAMSRGIPFNFENTVDFDYNQYTIQSPNMVMPLSQPAAPTSAATNRLAITADEMAELLGISRAHVWRLHSQGRIPRPVRLGRAVRWDRATIERWLAVGAPSRERWEAMHKGNN
jgi:excisionase family DNA binding protein